VSGDRRILWGLLAAAAVSVAVMPFLWRSSDPELTRRRNHIAAMTAPERERLQRNYATFVALPPADQEKLRAFHAELEADRTRGQGRTVAAFEIYTQWLQTLSAHERDALQSETEPARRLEQVRTLANAQRERRLEAQTQQSALRFEQYLGTVPLLSQKDLVAVLSVIERILLRSNTELARELEGYEGLRRSLKVLDLAAKKGSRLEQMLTDANVKSILDAISEERARELMNTLPPTPRPGSDAAARRIKVALLVLKNIASELDREHRRRALTPENVATFFGKLPLDEQDRMLELSAELFRTELRGKYIEAEWSDSVNISAVRDLLRNQEWFGRRPPEDRPFPGGRPPGFQSGEFPPPPRERFLDTPRDRPRPGAPDEPQPPRAPRPNASTRP
jgi:hypothetical protein